MRVLIAGASGLIGTALATRLGEAGHEVHKLVRGESRAAGEYRWDPPAGRIADGAFDGVDAVVNLCGAPLFPKRWSAARKQVLLDSRIEPTDVLAQAVAEHGITLLVNGSAVGFYGDTGSATVDENSRHGEGFLAGLCVAWETATAPAKAAGARVVSIRTGPVLSGKGGLIGTLKPLFSLALGGKLGNGAQYMSWISVEDVISAIAFVLDHESLSGPVNLTGPKPSTNAEFTQAFGHLLHRPAPWRAPGIAMTAVLGQVAEEMALFGQRAVPRALENAGFTFRHKDVESALAASL
jgi:uncharacterized protein (TIGR01777 family)